MAKRKNGEGTWGTKIIKGKEYRFFRDKNGKYFYGKTDKDVRKKIKDYQEKREQSAIDNEQILYDYVSNHLKMRKLNLESTTYDTYEDVAKNMLKNYTVGNIAMSVLTEDNLRSYVEELSQKYSRASIEKLYKVLKPALQYAVEHGDIEENYLKHIKIPSEKNVAVKEKDIPFITENDLIKLYQESKRINIKGFNWGGRVGQPTYGSNAQAIVLIGYTGLRISELRGLKWENVDVNNKKLYVKTAVVRVKSRDENSKTKYIDEEKAPKSDSSNREIPLCDIALEMIDYFDKQHPNHKPNDFVVLNKNGNSPNARNIQTTLDAMLIRGECSISHCGLHGLRHGFGAILLSNKVDIKIVSKLLGHKKISTTYDIYIDFTKEQISNEVMSVLNK